jgi:hypothetical protein
LSPYYLDLDDLFIAAAKSTPATEHRWHDAYGLTPERDASFTTLSGEPTRPLPAAHARRPEVMTSGYQRALLVCSVLVLLAALIASRTPNARAAAQPLVVPEPAL